MRAGRQRLVRQEDPFATGIGGHPAKLFVAVPEHHLRARLGTPGDNRIPLRVDPNHIEGGER